MPPVIELATPEDADELGSLRHALYAEYDEADVPHDEYVAAFHAFAERALADPAWRAWVAREDGRIVATMWVHVIERVPQPIAGGGDHPIGYLTNAYVDPALRNAGLGSRMLAAILEWAAADGVGPIVCWPAPGEDAERFYRRAGFSRETAPLTLDLPGSPAP